MGITLRKNKAPLATQLIAKAEIKSTSADDRLEQADSLIRAATEARAKAETDRAHSAALAQAAAILDDAGVTL